jgi:protein-S-isoprenylcysteine O-methyltransferase Ste14
MAVLAALYLLIAGRKLVGAVDAIAATSSSTWNHQLILMVDLVSGAIFYAILGGLMLTRKEPIRRETRLIGWVLPIMPTIVFSVLGWYEPRDYPTSVMLVATAFVLIGTGFMLYALRHLGRHFGVVSDVRGLVTSGPYVWMRHPLYGAEALAAIGLVIAIATPVTVAVFAVGMALQVWRAKVEEQALTAAFPEYRDYAARTPMLFPLTKLSFPGRVGIRTAE